MAAGFRVLPHGACEELNARLWRVEGRLPRMVLRRVMTLARTGRGEIVVHSAIALEGDLMARIEAWGKPAWLVVPNGFHRLDAPAFKERYPDLKVLCPRGSRKKVEQVVAVDGTYEDFPADPHVRLETLAGTGEREGVMVVESEGEVSLVFNDVLFNMPHAPGVAGFVLRALHVSGGPRVDWAARLLLVKDKGALREHLERLAALPGLRRIIVSHHEVIDNEPARVLKEVAATLA